MKMPFGKYKGQEVDGLAPDYLWWLWNNIELKGRLREEVYQLIWERKDEERPCVPGQVQGNFECVRRIYHELCHKYHPDKGGNNAAMAAVNEFYTKVSKLLSS